MWLVLPQYEHAGDAGDFGIFDLKCRRLEVFLEYAIIWKSQVQKKER